MDCGKRRRALRKWANMVLNICVNNGLLQHWRGQPCADCAAPAYGYEHRDYFKPLDVVPICLRCNNLRGMSINLKGDFMIPQVPTGDEFKQWLAQHSLTRKRAAELCHMSERQLDRYCLPSGSTGYQRIPLSRWELLKLRVAQTQST